ncbi:MAG: hypothetical protein F4Z01_02440 [Gammaproteobacteria bacterium]|nr:hypothetical protein [Gammaproteobacteria bacterium]MYF38635.1 hypothetical protein [Gammaproteobacteria bacterium]
MNDSVNKTQQICFVLLGLGLGLVFGCLFYFGIGKLVQPQRSDNAESLLNTETVRRVSLDVSAEQSDFDWILRESGSTLGLRKVAERLSGMSTEDLMEVMRASAAQPIAHGRHDLQEMLCENLVERSLEKGLESVWLLQEYRRSDLLPIVFREWALKDLEQSFEVSIGLEQPYKEVALNVILESVSLNEDRLAAFSQSYEVDLGALDEERRREQEWFQTISESPYAAFDMLIVDDVENSQQIEHFKQVVNELFQLEGLDVIQRLVHFDSTTDLFEELFIQIAEQDRVGTLEFIQNLSWIPQNLLVRRLMHDWIPVDIERAIDSVHSLNNPPFRRIALRSLYSAWGQSLPLELMDRIQDVPRGYRYDAMHSVAHSIGSTQPNTFLRKLPTLREIPGAINDDVERAFVSSWSDIEPAKALEWVQDTTKLGSEKRARMLNSLIYNYARVHPNEAMDMANSEGPHPHFGEYGLELRIFEVLVIEQIDVALNLLDKVRQEARATVYSEVARKLVEERRYDEAISLADSVPAEDRVRYFNRAIMGLRYLHSSEVVTWLTRIPNAELRSTIVNDLLRQEWILERHYTKDQIEALRALVAD